MERARACQDCGNTKLKLITKYTNAKQVDVAELYIYCSRCSKMRTRKLLKTFKDTKQKLIEDWNSECKT